MVESVKKKVRVKQVNDCYIWISATPALCIFDGVFCSGSLRIMEKHSCIHFFYIVRSPSPFLSFRITSPIKIISEFDRYHSGILPVSFPVLTGHDTGMMPLTYSYYKLLSKRIDMAMN